MRYIISVLAGILVVFFVISCSDNDSSPSLNTNLSGLTLNIKGLEDLGPSAQYEGWVIVDGSPVSIGTFTVDSTGQFHQTTSQQHLTQNLTQNLFLLNAAAAEKATTFILTIEPKPDPNPEPSDVRYLAGDFQGNSASLSVNHSQALNTDFSTASAKYMLGTPTTARDDDTNETSGLWFIDISSGISALGPGLELPELPEGWVYEGWADVGGIPVSTGKFTDPKSSDQSGVHSGEITNPPFPGEDFLVNPPAGLTFPLDLSGQRALVSIEPAHDNSANPFGLTIFTGNIPSDANEYTNYPMQMNSSVFPTGTVTR
jgi:hypothetical protein